MRDKKEVDPDLRRGGEKLGEIDGRKTITSINYIGKKFYFNIRGEI